jgi:hypothetical protein
MVESNAVNMMVFVQRMNIMNYVCHRGRLLCLFYVFAHETLLSIAGNNIEDVTENKTEDLVLLTNLLKYCFMCRANGKLSTESKILFYKSIYQMLWLTHLSNQQ